ncbi:MAG: hypothetical protein ABW218_04440 [Casimicrobiaceae bacterium]
MHIESPVRAVATHGAGTSTLAVAAVFAAVAVGCVLRLDQIGAQVLIDDEWHAVHQVLARTPGDMLLDFGYSDYSIPLGVLAWLESRAFGLSESLLRAPMLVCGIATLVAFPLYVARRLPPATVAVFAWLLAISPLLVIYSRMARPYAITLLLGWTAHAAFRCFWDQPQGGARAGLLYGAAATLATWLHPIIGPFVLAPFVWAMFELRRVPESQRRLRLRRLAGLALPTAAAMAVLMLPPLLAHPFALIGKGGVDSPSVETLVGAAHAWLGTPHGAVVLLCLALAALGARDVTRALPEARTGALGVALTFLAIVATRPAWSHNAVAVARYLLPFVPLLLLAVAAGAVRAARWMGAATGPRRALAAAIATVPCVALAVHSPLYDLLRRPNSQTLHLLYHFDFRPDRNAYLPYVDKIPMSPFWISLAAFPRDSLFVVAAPFHFESYNWDAPRWERLSGQRVVPAFLTGFCVGERFGEVPVDRAFRFRNAVHLADRASLAARGVDYIVWQKPFEHPFRGGEEVVGAATAHCEAKLREALGPAAYEDHALVAYRLKPARKVTDAP